MIHGWQDKPPTRDEGEQDLYTRWRHVVHWQRGERRKIKRRTHKWMRRRAKAEIEQERDYDD